MRTAETDSASTSEEIAAALNIGAYDRILVMDFHDMASSGDATTRFPDMIAAQLRSDTGFTDVAREGEATEGTLVISGDIT